MGVARASLLVAATVTNVAILVGGTVWWFGRGERNTPPHSVAGGEPPVRTLAPGLQATVEPVPTQDAVGAASTPGEAAPPSPAEAHLARGRFLAERNVADSVGATKEALLEAEAELKAALAGGVHDRKQALLLLADVYNSLRQKRWSGSLAASATHRALERDVRREVVELDPQDAEAHFRYAVTLRDPAEEVRELARAVRLDPEHLLARRALGLTLLRVGRTHEGARTLLDVARRMPADDLVGDGNVLVHALEYYGRPQEAREIERLMAAPGQEP